MASGGAELGDFKAFVAEHKDKVYSKIMEYLSIDAPKDFSEMMRSYVERKGQYRRPTYTILWNLLYGGKNEDSLLPAAAQQLSEDYFLMHDDWMDDNNIRRGLPTAHKLYGPEYAIDAGDALQTILWRVATDARDHLGAARGRKYFDKFQDIMLVTHIGQYLDLKLTREFNDITKFTPDDYINSIHAKSAYYSVYGPMQCGAIIAGASDADVAGIKSYGTLAGLAFQIKDDILDCTSNEATLGKTIGNDVKEGVKTMILWHAVHNADQHTLQRLKEIYGKKRHAKTKSDIGFALKKFDELGSIAFAEEEAQRLMDEAMDLFEKETRKIKESKIKAIARASISHTAKRSK
ncbi:MAG: polyprenyl synthetase family protein [Candidatus Micrarchaeota archaeon]|nr:polyprenyl synthetase family protein [Candidatus Micrarchaeota archaeon]